MENSVIGLDVELFESESFIGWAERYLEKHVDKFDAYVITKDGDPYSMLRTFETEYDFHGNVFTGQRYTKAEAHIIASLINAKARSQRLGYSCKVLSIAFIAESYIDRFTKRKIEVSDQLAALEQLSA
ncbi:hypothetical protein [Vibrio jasicida]|uniref:hypothetical protein n=1 Tax=Vibrio jasicida TaxID=766224 RepID=UPI000CE53D8D|nr:hypothetical protein [Vibrio jasicida]